MDDSEELRLKLKLVQSELATTQKVADEVAELLRKAEREREVANAEARQLRDEGEAVEAQCKKSEQENKRLRKEMEEL